MQFWVRPEVFRLLPGLTVAVAVGDGVRSGDRDGVRRAWHEAYKAAGERAAPYGNPQSHPRVAPWRDAFRTMGAPPRLYASSIEAMLRRAMKGDTPFEVSPLVDFYNAVSLRHTLPVGGFDLDRLSGPIELRLTRPGDRYHALDADGAVDVAPGEVAYADGGVVLTRHFVWRQGREGLIRADTRRVFLVSEALGQVGAPAAAQVRADLEEGLSGLFGAQVKGFALDAETPVAEW